MISTALTLLLGLVLLFFGAENLVRGSSSLALRLGVMAGFALILWPLSRTGHTLNRFEGLALLSGYIAYVAWLIAHA